MIITAEQWLNFTILNLFWENQFLNDILKAAFKKDEGCFLSVLKNTAADALQLRTFLVVKSTVLFFTPELFWRSC